MQKLLLCLNNTFFINIASSAKERVLRYGSKNPLFHEKTEAREQTRLSDRLYQVTRRYTKATVFSLSVQLQFTLRQYCSTQFHSVHHDG